jgi:TPR repeat protein
MEDQSNGKTLFTFVTARRVLIVLSIVAIAAFFTLITLYSERITAELGDTHAKFNLGVHYHDGDHGLPQDFAEAARWYH